MFAISNLNGRFIFTAAIIKAVMGGGGVTPKRFFPLACLNRPIAAKNSGILVKTGNDWLKKSSFQLLEG